MARLGRNGFLAIAVIFHLVYIYSIFDIYFVSPIVSGMQAFRAPGDAPAKRLVIFVGDGLRADKAFQSFPDPSAPIDVTTPARPLTPFLRSRILQHGTFGVSHTRVPTESRPGHVALIAGLYEDVSAVATGWKLNPVNFDSVFNRSRHTWSWGSPDILPMFQYGAVPGRVDADMYESKDEDFSGDATFLDLWVFDKVKNMFKEAEVNKTLNARLREDKNVFFLHLLGLDTIGHSKRPYSREYLNNIQVVDRGVQEITELIEKFYGDDQTAFVFTADHGMTDWGAHGDGHPDSTRTPLIVWGAGAAKPVTVTGRKAPGHDDFSSDWNLDHVQRHDVAQADIAALMAYLAGLEFPTNSVGELPLSYLSADDSSKASALLANARGLLEQYRVKEERKKEYYFRYKPYHPIGDFEPFAQSFVSNIENLLQDGQYSSAIDNSEQLMTLSLEGLRYLQTYDWLFLRTLVSIGYLGWIAFALTTVIDIHVLSGQVTVRRSMTSTITFASGFVLLCSYLLIQRSPLTYYLYSIFPFAFWEEVIARREALTKGFPILFGNVKSFNQKLLVGVEILAFVGVLETLVFSYFYRELYTIMYIVGIFWPLLYGLEFVRRNFLVSATWAVCCALMSLFTLLPVIKKEDVIQITFGGILMALLGIAYLLFGKSIMVSTGKGNLAAPKADGLSRSILGGQIGLVVLAMIATYSSATSMAAERGLPFGSQVLGWVVLVSSIVVPFLHSLQPDSNYLHRLVVMFLAFAPAFIILTISYEGLFYFTFCILLLTWVRMEHRVYRFTTQKFSANTPSAIQELNPITPALAATKDRLSAMSKSDYRTLSLADARVALFFLFLVQSGFFSTGNIASMAAFSLDAVKRLIPVFDPFSQAALLVFKMLIPFAIISANLGILNRRLGVAPSALFMIVSAISDVLTLNFFYMVRDEGSWLDIGMTISHFVVASLICVFVAGLEFISEVLVRGVEFDDDDISNKVGKLVGAVKENGHIKENGAAKPAARSK